MCGFQEQREITVIHTDVRAIEIYISKALLFTLFSLPSLQSSPLMLAALDQRRESEDHEMEGRRWRVPQGSQAKNKEFGMFPATLESRVSHGKCMHWQRLAQKKKCFPTQDELRIFAPETGSAQPSNKYRESIKSPRFERWRQAIRGTTWSRWLKPTAMRACKKVTVIGKIRHCLASKFSYI